MLVVLNNLSLRLRMFFGAFLSLLMSLFFSPFPPAVLVRRS